MTHSLIGKIHAGYTIITQGETAVIAQAGEHFVTWTYKQINTEVDFFWGRYGSYEYVKECFNKKERGEYSG